MNGIFTKIILAFIGFFLLTILLVFSFFNNDEDNLNIENFNISEIIDSSDVGFISSKIDFFTTVYSLEKDYTFSENKIKLSDGIYVIDSNNFLEELIIDMGTNNIVLENGGLVYIDNRKKYKKIVSFNNKLEINFIDKITGNKTAKLYLYPHMYFAFNPLNFVNVKEADSLRFSQLGILKYFNDSFKDIIEGGGLVFIEENKDFLKKVLKKILKNNEEYSKEFNEKKNIKVNNINGDYYIEKYFYIFYNNRKKVIYYKNKILDNLIILLNTDTEDNEITNEILSDFENIKNLDLDEYNNMKEITKKISFLVYKNLDENSHTIQKNYNKLLIKLFSIENNFYIIRNIDKYNYFGIIKDYLKILISDINYKNMEPLEKEYYILLKQNILTSNFKNGDLDQEYFDILLELFISYSNNIDKNLDSDEKDRFMVNILYNIDLLEILNFSLKKRYFEEEKNSQGLLVLKGIEIKKIKDLEYGIEKLLNNYNKGKHYFDEKLGVYSTLEKRYKDLETDINESILSLSNYLLYEKTYSKVNEKLIKVVTYKEGEDRLTKDDFINYIKGFSGIDFQTINMEIIDDNFYKVNYISINNKGFSFDLYPYNGNIVNNIKLLEDENDEIRIKGKSFYDFLESTSFSLNTEERKYKIFISKAKDEDKYLYNFKNFFINKFFLIEEKKKNNYDEGDMDNKNSSDDDIIRIFKTSKLLGTKGEFNTIKDFIDIKYNNLNVERKADNNYSIKIKNSILDFNIQKNNYFIYFDSEYKLENNKHYFHDMKLKIFYKNNNGKKSELFPGVIFKITFKVQIATFENDIRNIFSKMDKIKKEYSSLKNRNSITTIAYSMRTGKYEFR